MVTVTGINKLFIKRKNQWYGDIAKTSCSKSNRAGCGGGSDWACFCYCLYGGGVTAFWPGAGPETPAANAANGVTTTWNFAYNGTTGADGSARDFTAPAAGNYKLEVWGAQGGSNDGSGGRGGYSVGIVTLTSGQVLHVYVGGQGLNGATPSGGWNGGGKGVAGPFNTSGGGGGTDIDTGTGNNWTDRIIIAGGGGGNYMPGGAGGGTEGLVGSGSNNMSLPTTSASGGGAGTSTAGGAGGAAGTGGGGAAGSAGTLGNGGAGATSGAANSSGTYPGAGGAGGGGGYYGGGGGGAGGGYTGQSHGGGGGGGSGYVGGVNTVSTLTKQTIAGNATMPAPGGGTETGHTGHGYARITRLAAPAVTKVATSAGAGVTSTYTVKSNGEWPNATIGTARTTRTVTITGTNLTAMASSPTAPTTAPTVTVGGTACTVTAYSDTSITCTLATTTKSGDQVVVVTTPGGSSSSTATAGTNAITYVAAPAVSSVSPTTAKTNGQGPDTLSGTTWTSVTSTTATITGTALNGAGFATTATVTVGGTACTTYTIASATSITCGMPNWGSTGTKAISVANAYGASDTATSVTAIAAPTLTSVSPNSGLAIAGGTSVTLTGTNFQSTFTTTVGGTNCTAIAYIDTATSTCTTTPVAGGSLSSSVVTRTPYGTSNGVNVTYGGGVPGGGLPPPPLAVSTITAVSPDKGLDNTTGIVITITGTNFTGAMAVMVGNADCVSFSVIDDTTISCTLPPFSTAGSRTVVVKNSAAFPTPPDTFYEVVAQYITLSSTDAVNLSVEPNSFSSGKTTTTVSTNDPDGYTLSMKASSANLTRSTAPAGTIATLSGYTAAAPASSTAVNGLIGSTAFWAYRVDGVGGFGASATAAQTNAASTPYSWATVPTADTILKTGAATDNLTTNTPANLDVWFGVSPTMMQPYGNYQTTITFTATTL